MIRHIVSWKLKESFTTAEREEAMRSIQERLEALPRIIDGIIDFKVLPLLPTSTDDLALISTFTDEEALASYQVHPAHQEAAAYVGTMRESRTCIDYVI